MKDTLEKVIELYGDILYRQAYILVGNKYDAEDILQEVFYKYMVTKPKFKNEQAKKAWLYKVTINKCYDLFRKKKVRKEVSLESLENQTVNQEKSEDLLQVIMMLPVKYKGIIYQFYYEGFKIEEIAKINRISCSAVKKRLQRGRQFLREKMKGEIDYEK